MIGRTVIVGAASILGAAAVQAQCGASKSEGPRVMAAAYGPKSDIVDTAASAGDFKTLVAAVKAAGLVDALKGDGPFTVFAPTDEAFAKLPKGTLENLLKPENKETLKSILTYHVVPGRLDAKRVSAQSGTVTLNGQRLNFAVKDGAVMIDNAKVTKADIACTNGVIHVIDTVVLPATDNIVSTAQSAGTFSTLLAAATEAGLASTLTEGGPYTIFAPTDEAFAKLPTGAVDELLKPENRDRLTRILKTHIVPGRVYSDDAGRMSGAKTLSGDKVKISTARGEVRFGGAKVIKADIDASNGVIHVIDTVVLPQE